jgi:serine protease Do
MTRIRWYGPTLVLLLTALLVMILGPSVARRIAHAQHAASIRLVKDELSHNPSLAELSDAFRKVATVVEPSVVHIMVYAREPGRDGPNPPPGLDDDFEQRIPEPFRDFFFGPEGRQLQPRRRGDRYEQYNPDRPYGNGSGWVYDERGHIITNFHVVQGAQRIEVRFQDGDKRAATLVNADPRTDIAVLKVEGDGLHPAFTADEPVEQGDIVFAFGSPFGFDFSMSQGIVSATGRKNLRIIQGGGYENFIQTDAAINPGNSGGPLTNINGQVVGMNTAIATRTGAYNGLGFAIPVAMVRDIADQIIKSGKVSRGYLGIYIEDLEPRMAKTFGFTGKGVLVVNPIAGGPADKAGIQSGDIITQVNAKPMDSADELRNYVASLEPGSQIKIELFRAGQLITMDLTITELPDSMAGASPRQTGENHDADAQGIEALRKLGIENARTLGDEERTQLEIDDNRLGVLVLAVRPNSAAANEGVARGTIIIRIMDQNVTTVEELTQALKDFDLTQGVRLSVLSRNPDGQWMPRFVLLQLPKN